MQNSNGSCNPEDILKDCVQEVFFYRHKDGGVGDITNWDKLADVNPIHAVISAKDEGDEQKKGERGIELLKEKLNDGVILDLGCGYGRVAKYLLPQRSFKCYVGLDSSVSMLNIFNKRHQERPEEQGTPIVLVNANIDKIPLRNNTVDNVIVSAVFLHNHKDSIKKSISEILRVIKPGGALFVVGSFPKKWSISGFQGGAYLVLLALLGKSHRNGPVRYFSEGEVKKMLSGFKKVDITKNGFEFLPKSLIFLPDFINRYYRRFVAMPVNNFVQRNLPSNVTKQFFTHYDVIAYK